MIDDLVLDKKFKNVGIRLSGGADSSILYYAICKYYKDTDTNIFPITIATKRKPWYIDGANRIIQTVGDLLGVYPTKHYTYFEDDDTVDDLGQQYIDSQDNLMDYAISCEDLEIVYSGLTVNPHNPTLIKFLNDNAETFKIDMDRVHHHNNKRDIARDNPFEWGPVDSVHGNGKVIANFPFISGDKKVTYKAYKDLDMLDVLYPLTFSCEDPDDYKNIETVKHCGHCFFCLERWYGFGKIV